MALFAQVWKPLERKVIDFWKLAMRVVFGWMEVVMVGWLSGRPSLPPIPHLSAVDFYNIEQTQMGEVVLESSQYDCCGSHLSSLVRSQCKADAD